MRQLIAAQSSTGATVVRGRVIRVVKMTELRHCSESSTGATVVAAAPRGKLLRDAYPLPPTSPPPLYTAAAPAPASPNLGRFDSSADSL